MVQVEWWCTKDCNLFPVPTSCISIYPIILHDVMFFVLWSVISASNTEEFQDVKWSLSLCGLELTCLLSKGLCCSWRFCDFVYVWTKVYKKNQTNFNEWNYKFLPGMFCGRFPFHLPMNLLCDIFGSIIIFVNLRLSLVSNQNMNHNNMV